MGSSSLQPVVNSGHIAIPIGKEDPNEKLLNQADVEHNSYKLFLSNTVKRTYELGNALPSLGKMLKASKYVLIAIGVTSGTGVITYLVASRNNTPRNEFMKHLGTNNQPILSRDDRDPARRRKKPIPTLISSAEQNRGIDTDNGVATDYEGKRNGS